jgi:hypothetical protein
MTIFSSKLAFREVTKPEFPAKRPAPFSLRLSAEERAELKKRADGMPLGAYIKSRIFTSGPGSRTRTRQVDRQELARVLSALGQSRLPQNMNQIAKAANLGTLPVTPETEEEIKQACYDIAVMRLMLMRALGKRDGGGS